MLARRLAFSRLSFKLSWLPRSRESSSRVDVPNASLCQLLGHSFENPPLGMWDSRRARGRPASQRPSSGILISRRLGPRPVFENPPLGMWDSRRAGGRPASQKPTSGMPVSRRAGLSKQKNTKLVVGFLVDVVEIAPRFKCFVH